MDGYRKGLILEYLTIGYNIVEALLSIFFGIIAGSPALIGFGMDSIVESLSEAVLIWRLRQNKDISKEVEKKIEKKAQRFVSITFFILSAWVLFESVRTLFQRQEPDASVPGIIIASVSLILMPTIAFMKRKTGQEIGSRALIADSKETLACAWLSLALLLGLLLNWLFGWWWADPVAGLVIVTYLVKEGFELWRDSS